jgi:cyclic pyranopterin phosphate synthase
MPKEVFGRNYQFLPQTDLLSFEEIERAARAFVGLGVRKLRLTGGEPLMRRELETLVAKLAAIPGAEDIALTTNGSFPLERIHSLKDAGLKRMTVSLDALDDATFMSMNDVDFPVQAVLDWIEASAAAGLGPVKVNMVVKRGTNDRDVISMARHFKGSGHILRFIEFMDVGHTNGWKMQHVVPSRELVARINAEFPIEPVEANYTGEVAERWRYRDGSGEVGFISSVTQAFCKDCTRLRLSAEGSIYTCLFATQGTDLRGLLRTGATDEEVSEAIAAVWRVRGDRYSELRTEDTAKLRKVEMSYIGG